MMALREFLARLKFWSQADRIGPDIPTTHWRLYFKPTMRRLCEAKFSRFGTDAEFRPGAYAVACSKIMLGDRVIIRPGSMLFADPSPGGAGIIIENDVMLGSGVHIYVHNHRFDDLATPISAQGHYPSRPVVLEHGSWVGANAILLPGIRIGRNAVVGAGSVVTRDVPQGTVAAGNPARVLRTIAPETVIP